MLVDKTKSLSRQVNRVPHGGELRSNTVPAGVGEIAGSKESEIASFSSSASLLLLLFCSLARDLVIVGSLCPYSAGVTIVNPY